MDPPGSSGSRGLSCFPVLRCFSLGAQNQQDQAFSRTQGSPFALQASPDSLPGSPNMPSGLVGASSSCPRLSAGIQSLFRHGLTRAPHSLGWGLSGTLPHHSSVTGEAGSAWPEHWRLVATSLYQVLLAHICRTVSLRRIRKAGVTSSYKYKGCAAVFCLAVNDTALMRKV